MSSALWKIQHGPLVHVLHALQHPSNATNTDTTMPRPPIYEKALNKRRMTIRPADERILERIGEGNRSGGLRRIVDYIRANDLVATILDSTANGQPGHTG